VHQRLLSGSGAPRLRIARPATAAHRERRPEAVSSFVGWSDRPDRHRPASEYGFVKDAQMARVRWLEGRQRRAPTRFRAKSCCRFFRSAYAPPAGPPAANFSPELIPVARHDDYRFRRACQRSCAASGESASLRRAVDDARALARMIRIISPWQVTDRKRAYQSGGTNHRA
jgi:hypothetical protein